ncbi:hypothetical protein [Alcaligenes endophyticus]|uniref:hypothetical protein n=1 Tax=Alcaligenes endophyticus TaxID=1929088 RepID=UPI0033931DF6
MFRTTLPPLTNEFIILIKANPALSVITLVELTLTAQIVMNLTFRPMEAFTAAAILFFCLLFTLSNATRYLEYRIKRASRWHSITPLSQIILMCLRVAICQRSPS